MIENKVDDTAKLSTTTTSYRSKTKKMQLIANCLLFVTTLFLVILILDYPFKIKALEEQEQVFVQKVTDKIKNDMMDREEKQLWQIFPSPILVADPITRMWTSSSELSPPPSSNDDPLLHTQAVQGSPRGLLASNEGVGAKISELSIFSKFTKPFSKLEEYDEAPAEKNKVFLGEMDKTKLEDKLIVDSFEVLPRVKSVISENDFQSRTSEDLEFVESVNSLLGTLSRQAIDNYYAGSEDREAMLEPEEVILPYPSARQPNTDLNHFGRPDNCCLFIFLDGSAYYFDEFLRKLTGYYRLMYGTVNGHPHYVSRNCKNPESYNGNCTYIWYSGYGWVVGVGRYIGQTKGVIYTKQEATCPSGLTSWRYLNEDLDWKDNGNIVLHCAS